MANLNMDLCSFGVVVGLEGIVTRIIGEQGHGSVVDELYKSGYVYFYL
jgi:hypothetical protein